MWSNHPGSISIFSVGAGSLLSLDNCFALQLYDRPSGLLDEMLPK